MSIDLNLLIHAYSMGVFPMSDGIDDDEIYWMHPEERAIIPLNGLHISKSLAKNVRQDIYHVTSDQAFVEVIDACAAPADDRKETWINDQIREAFIRLHHLGLAHSIECWQDDKQTGERRLVGGLYGLALGGLFCGESMFSRANNASKIALVWLVARLRAGGFTLLDTQYMTDHLASMGAVMVSGEDYAAMLHQSLVKSGIQVSLSSPLSVDSALSASSLASAPADWGALDGEFLGSADFGKASSGKLILQSLMETS
ncbi:leucyl/phenylalanyl-tRNA--protein transferase [Sphingorhabdus lutea]|uniref:leucyl/phenylalanyl-tRNA--protein transferase n=1 Tax=Sphingorhabdus lutea TaxID=1913578 RepID=UPI000933C002|nr:leucyl/phenylalanyl-tRNA--protein transferase [Sphingorhabdus lutea]